jgi:hypothetical protein
MIFTSTEMIEAARESRENHYNIVKNHEKECFHSGFYAGALWAAKKMEESRRCHMKYFGDGYICDNCRQIVGESFNHCYNCGYKFIKEGK